MIKDRDLGTAARIGFHKRSGRARVASAAARGVERLERRTLMTAVSTLASFSDLHGGYLNSGLVSDSAGNAYGVSSAGESTGDGVVFEIPKGTGSVVGIGPIPQSLGTDAYGLAIDPAGNVYGVTGSGGADGDGSAFEVVKGSGVATGLVSFNQSHSGLVVDGNGNLFGYFTEGGPSNEGLIFEIVKGSGAVSTVASFDGSEGYAGYYPDQLLVDSNGNLFGATEDGGGDYVGAIFEITKGSGVLTPLASFQDDNYGSDATGLVIDGGGNLYGTLESGGAGYGSVFELPAGSGTITEFASFNQSDGAYPAGDSDYYGQSVALDGHGNLFGTTIEGGADSYGTVFEVNLSTGTITTLYSINSSSATPLAGIALDGNGNLFTADYGQVSELTSSGSYNAVAVFYNQSPESPGGVAVDSSGDVFGSTTHGGLVNNIPSQGLYGDGMAFEVANGAGSVSDLSSFGFFNPNAPDGVVLDSAGDLFGIAGGGTGGPDGEYGTTGDGIVFEIPKGSHTATTIASFNGTDGTDPYDLTVGADGNLYGLTSQGGPEGEGTVFEIVPSSGVITSLTPNYGYYGSLSGTIAADSKGDVFGTIESGGAYGYGAIVEIVHSSGQLTTIYSFNNSSGGVNGVYPDGGVILDAKGNLYGTTVEGGPYNNGTVYELAAGASVVTNLASFNGYNGADAAGLIRDAAGDLFGASSSGGQSSTGALSSNGNLFEVFAGSGTVTNLYSFTGDTDGSAPIPTTLVLDSAGDLFGATSQDGASSFGTLFELPSKAAAVTTLYSFTGGTDGSDPVNLVADSAGDLFGSTAAGGTNGTGDVFEVLAGKTSPTTTYSFPVTVAQGIDPSGTVVVDSAGNEYGTTEYGGQYGLGVVYEISKSTGIMTTLASFDGTDGAIPTTGLVIDSNGDLFGTTLYGGYNFYSGDYYESQGTVFEIAKGTATITDVGQFDGYDGDEPQGIALDAAGDIFGVTEYSGYYDGGTAFEIADGSDTVTELAEFDSDQVADDGYYPEGGVALDASGDLYGITESGGINDEGTVWELPFQSGAIETVASFLNSADSGNGPRGGVAVDTAGDVFGVTAGGGLYGQGTVYEVAVGSDAETTLVSFDGADGADPQGGITMDAKGDLIGTTDSGGASDDGAVFEVSGPFAVAPGIAVQPAPQQTTPGQVVSFTAAASGISTPAVQWQISTDGGNTWYSIPGATSKTYSFTANAGQNGEMFRAGFTNPLGTATTAPATLVVAGKFTTLYSYQSPTQQSGPATVVFDSAGDLFGVANGDGANYDGSVYEIPGGSTTPQTIASFDGTDGADPNGIVIDSSGNLYGIADSGGADNDGVVFEVAAGSGATTVLASLDGTDGENPSNIAIDSGGNLFVTTTNGGIFGDGTLFEITASTNRYVPLFNFNYSTDGERPVGLTLRSGGLVYGTTEYGGTSEYGIVYDLTPLPQAAPVVLVAPTGQSGTAGGVVTFDAVASGNPQPTVQWQVSSSSGGVYTNITGATSDAYSFAAASGQSGDLFRAVFTNAQGSVMTTGAVLTVTSSASTDSWTGAADGINWSVAGNWSAGRVPTQGDDVTIAAGFTKIDVPSGTFSVRSLNASSPIEVSAGATLNLYGNATFGGGLVVDTGAVVHAAASPLVVVINGASFTDNGTIDLGGNGMVIHNGILAAIESLIAGGYAQGKWTGIGITSSTAAGDTTHLSAVGVMPDANASQTVYSTFNGVSLVATDVLVKYTYVGDANLSGLVDGSDYSLIDYGYIHHLTGWFNGDFNHDGTVDGSDYALIDNAFNNEGPRLGATPSALIAGPTAQVDAATSPAVTAAPGARSKPETSRARSQFAHDPGPVTAVQNQSETVQEQSAAAELFGPADAGVVGGSETVVELHKHRHGSR